MGFNQHSMGIFHGDVLGISWIDSGYIQAPLGKNPPSWLVPPPSYPSPIRPAAYHSFPQSGIFQPAKLREPPHFDWQQNTLGNNVIPSPYFYTLENHICWNLTVLVGQHLESCCLKMGHLYLLANFIRNMVIPRGFSSPLVSLRMQFASSCFTALPPCPFGEIVPFWTKLGVQFQFKLVKWYTTIVMLYRVLLYYIMFYPNSCCLSPGLLPIKPKKKYPGREPLRLCVPSRPPTSHHEASATPVGELLPWGPILLAPRQIAECDE